MRAAQHPRWSAQADGAFSTGSLCAPPFQRRQRRISETFRQGGRGWILDCLTHNAPLPTADQDRALAALRSVRSGRIGGEFWAGNVVDTPRHEFILLRPRTEQGAVAMLRWALRGHSPSALLISAPDQRWTRLLASMLPHGVTLHLGPADPWLLLDGALHVCVEGEDPVALLALGAGLTVGCFAPCDLSGWGLTDDVPGIARRGARTLAHAAHAALIAGVLYRDPFDGETAQCEQIIEILKDWRRLIERNKRVGCCTGISLWKRNSVSALLHTGVRAAPIRRSARAAAAAAQRRNGGIAVWTSRTPPRLAKAAVSAGASILHVEDGFLRSRGLGCNFTPPCSIVVDASAPHYDAEIPSELETLLTETDFSPELVARAERLINLLNRLELTKYNVGEAVPPAPETQRRRVLVAGQVEDDLSVRFAGAGMSNLDLLARAREAEPGALILFKPHPDVEAGHRRGALTDRQALRHADVIVRHGSMASLLAQVEAVHVLSSLTGFEALLRRREVVTHGRPFYAGWGLTHDLQPPSRRGRPLSLAELVAGALILYPLYRDPVSRLPCSPELVAARLASQATSPSAFTQLRVMQGLMRLALTSVLGRKRR